MQYWVYTFLLHIQDAQIIAGVELATETHICSIEYYGKLIGENMINPTRSYNNFYMDCFLIKKKK